MGEEGVDAVGVCEDGGGGVGVEGVDLDVDAAGEVGEDGEGEEYHLRRCVVLVVVEGSGMEGKKEGKGKGRLTAMSTARV